MAPTGSGLPTELPYDPNRPAASQALEGGAFVTKQPNRSYCDPPKLGASDWDCYGPTFPTNEYATFEEEPLANAIIPVAPKPCITSANNV